MSEETNAKVFVHRRAIAWGDADPAGIVYTPRFFHFAVEAIEAWFAVRLGTPWPRIWAEHGCGTPFVHAEIDFRAMLRPGDALGTGVALGRAGRSSLTFRIEGTRGDGVLAFEGRFICAFVEHGSGRPRPVPEALVAAVATEAALALTGS